jgi:membrane-bound lytic murein transglycosylase B
MRIAAAVLLVLCLAGFEAAAKEWDPLIDRLVADGFDRQKVTKLFHRTRMSFDPDPMRTKVNRLTKILFNTSRTKNVQAALKGLGYEVGKVDGRYGRQTRKALEAYQRDQGLSVDGLPTRTLYNKLRKELPSIWKPPVPPPTRASKHWGVLKRYRLQEAEAFCRDNSKLLAEAQRAYNIPYEIAASILTVETRLGKNLGRKNVFRTLAGMAACVDYKKIKPHLGRKRMLSNQETWRKGVVKKKAEWAYGELKALLHYAEANDLDPLAMPGSIYGALGIGQFMPSSALKYGADAQGDGRVDLFDLEDAVFSVCSYIRAHAGEEKVLDEKSMRKAIWHYNHSTTYVNTVMSVAEHLRKKVGPLQCEPAQTVATP